MSSARRSTVHATMRLDQFVAESFGLSRSQGLARIREKYVSVNGEIVIKGSRKVKQGDTVEFIADDATLPDPQAQHCKHRNALPSFEVLYEDSECFVIDKPVGVAVHPSITGDPAEATILESLMRERGGTLILVHRLDKGTSGCLLVAKNPRSGEFLQKQFKDRTVRKQYLAIISGIPARTHAIIQADIGRNLVDRTKMSVFQTSTSRHAVTEYTILKKGNNASLLSCEIRTGRTHQIRVHLSAISHPILGDRKYENDESRAISKKLGINAMCLHAQSLQFQSPETNRLVRIEATIPVEFQDSLRKVGITSTL